MHVVVQVWSDPIRDPSSLPPPFVVTAAKDSLVPERYIITKSDPRNGTDTDLDANCTPHGDVSVSCPGRDGGRLFDKMGPSSMNANWKMSHHWRPSQSGEDVQVELVFAWPVTISETTWNFFLGMNSGFPPSSNWSVTAIAENGRDNISQYIAGSHKSVGPSYIVNMSNFDGFPASRRWRFIIPLPASNELFLYEVSISGKVEQIGECRYICRHKMLCFFSGIVREVLNTCVPHSQKYCVP